MSTFCPKRMGVRPNLMKMVTHGASSEKISDFAEIRILVLKGKIIDSEAGWHYPDSSPNEIRPPGSGTYLLGHG